MLEAIDGFILVLGTDGHILYTSESLASLLGYLPSSLHNTTLYEMVSDSDKIPLYNTLNASNNIESGDQFQVRWLTAVLNVFVYSRDKIFSVSINKHSSALNAPAFW